MAILLWICCIVSEHLFLGTLPGGCFWNSSSVLLFPEICWVYFFYQFTRLNSWMCIRIYIFCFKNKTLTHKQKAKETKEEKIIPVENLTGYNDIVCKMYCVYFQLMWSSCEFLLVVHIRCSHQRCSIKKLFLKILQILAGKHQCWSLFLTKLNIANIANIVWISRNF